MPSLAVNAVASTLVFAATAACRASSLVTAHNLITVHTLDLARAAGCWLALRQTASPLDPPYKRRERVDHMVDVGV